MDFDMGAIAIQWGKEQSSQKVVWGQLAIYIPKNETKLQLHMIHKNQLEMDQRPKRPT